MDATAKIIDIEEQVINTMASFDNKMVHHRSSGAYEMLRKSGILSLPSSRTLRDYRHLSPSSSPGFSTTADIQLLDMIKLAKPNHLAKYVLILVDEIYLKEGLV